MTEPSNPSPAPDARGHSSQRLHVVLGAGPVGQTLARQLLADGDRVRLVSRSGGGSEVRGAEIARADAASLPALLTATSGADVIHNALNPPYSQWAQQWPSMHRNVMTAAEQHRAPIVMIDNLYGYGDPQGRPMSSSTPQRPNSTNGRVRAEMADELLAAQASGRLQVAIVRASDFIGPLVAGSSMGDRVIPRVLAGKTVQVLGATDQPHSLTYMPDIARTMAAVAADERAWGNIWHVPSAPALTQRESIERLAAAAGTTVKISSVPNALFRLIGLFNADLRAMQQILYQFRAPFVIDALDTERTFGLSATPFDVAAAQTVAWYRDGTLPAPVPTTGFTRRSH